MRTALAFAIVVCSLAAAACDGSPFPSSPAPAKPIAAVSVVTAATVSASSFACPGAQLGVNDVTLFVTAAQSSLFLDTVTLRLGDGSNVSGESITFPRAGLDAQFGTTFVRVGSRRPFALRPAFGCVPVRSGAGTIRAEIVLADESGRRQSIVTSASLQ